MLLLKFKAGALCWEFGALFLHRQNIIILQTNSNFILFSIKNTIPTESHLTPIHQKITAEMYARLVISK